MVEPIMYFGIGFGIAIFLAVIVLPLVHNRAVRLTMRRLEAVSMPLSMAELQADKDSLRAEFAISTRRLEMSIEQLKAKTTSQLVDLGRQTDAINGFKAELTEKTVAILALEEREAALKDQLRIAEQEHLITTGILGDAHNKLAEKEAELGRQTDAINGFKAELTEKTAAILALEEREAALKDQLRIAEQEHLITTGILGDAHNKLAEKEAEFGRQTDAINGFKAELTEKTVAILALEEREAALKDQLRIAEQEHLITTGILRDAHNKLAEKEAELGRQTDAINGFKAELTEKAAAIVALEEREAALEDQLRIAEQEHLITTGILGDAHNKLAEKEAENSRLTTELSNRMVVSDRQRAEILALRTQIEALKNQVKKTEKEVCDSEEQLNSTRADADNVAKALGDERAKIDNLNAQLAELNRQLLAQQVETTHLNRHVQDLQARFAEQGRVLAKREFEANQSRREADTAREAARAGKATLVKELERIRNEREREITSMKWQAIDNLLAADTAALPTVRAVPEGKNSELALGELADTINITSIDQILLGSATDGAMVARAGESLRSRRSSLPTSEAVDALSKLWKSLRH